MHIRKSLLITLVTILLAGCQNANSEVFNEIEFYTSVREDISSIADTKIDSSISTDREFSERLQQVIMVLNIQFMFESEDIYKVNYQDMIINLKQAIDLETLRTNYDLIHISFIYSKEEEVTVYEYLNMTNSFAENDSSLTNLNIDK